MEGVYGINVEHYSYVEDESQFPSELICTVCHDVAGMHTACPGCSQTFCQNCVHKWFNTQKSNASACTCPYCRRKLKFSDLKHDAAIQKKLDQLQVYCPNKQSGCTAIVARSSLPAHLNRSCWAQHGSCKYCGKPGLRKDISEHESSICPERPVPCSNAVAGCAALAPCNQLQWHLDYACDLQPRPCPHCQQSVPRFRWASHLERDCPAQQFCPLRLYGCSYSGTAEQVQQHSEQCAYVQHRQQLQQQLLAGNVSATSAADAAAKFRAILAEADMAEVPAGCVIDSYQAFDAPRLARSAARASQLIKQALPDCMLPPRLQQDSNWMVARVTAAEQAESPATLATLTPPEQIVAAAAAAATQDTAGTTAEVNIASSSCCSSSLSAAEALALGTPQCLVALGIESEAWVEAAWRIMQNLNMVDILSSDMSDLQHLPGSFILYTAICRAWDTVARILGPQQQQPARHQGGSSSANGIAAAAAAPGASTGNGGAAAAAATGGVSGRIQITSRSSGSSSRSGSSTTSSESQEDSAIPGLERGLFEDEFEDLEGWLWHQRDMLNAVATVTYHVLQLWMGVGPIMGEPQLDAQLHELQQAAVSAFQIVAEVARTKGTSKRRSSSGRQDAAAEQPRQSGRQQQDLQQQQQSAEHRGSGLIAVPADEGPSWSTFGLSMFRRLTGTHTQRVSQPSGTNSSSTPHSRHVQLQQQQQSSVVSTAAAAAAPNMSGTSAAASASAAVEKPAPVVAEDISHQFESYSAALQCLQQLGSRPPLPHKSNTPELLHGRPPGEAIELATAVLILHHVRQQHIEISMIPQTTPLLQHGFRAYWAPGILAAGRAWLGPRFKLSWQAVAVLNDMVMGLAGRLLDVINEGFFEPESGRVPMSPRLAMAAVQLVMPPGLMARFLPRVAGLSRAYHDEECEELSDVTWNALQLRLGLKLELDKLVTLVDQHLPVQYYGDEDEDEDEDSYTGDDDDDDEDEESAASTEDDDQSDSEYTTDDEYMQEQSQQQEQQQQLLPQPSSSRGGGGGAVPGCSVLSGAGRQTSESESSWESADDLEQCQLGDQPAASSAAAAATTSSTGVQGEGLLDCHGGSSSGVEGYRHTMEIYLQQQQQQAGTSAAAAAAATHDVSMREAAPQQPISRTAAEVAAAGSALHAEFVANLDKLSSTSHSWSHFEQHLLQEMYGPLDGPTEPPAENLTGSLRSALQQQQQQHNVSEPPSAAQQRQQQQQQQQEDKEGGDTTTHGVVILAGFLESVLQQLLEAAAQAAGQAAAQAAGGGVSATVDSDVSMQIEAAAAAAASHQATATRAAVGAGVPLAQQQQQSAVHITARHVLLAAAGNPDMKAMLLDRPGAQNQSNPAAVAWAGVVPGFDSRILPQSEDAPLTCWLYSLAAGNWQHREGAGIGSSSSGCSACRILFPADLQYYCGQTWSTGSSAEPAVAAGAGAAAAAAAVHVSASTAPAIGSTGHGVTCCFLSGLQCGECAAATAALPHSDLDARLDACRTGLVGLAVPVAGESGMGTPSAAGVLEPGLVLACEQVQQLMNATRLYHLQQQWWFESAQASGSSNGSAGNSRGSSSLPPAWQSLPAVDQAQLANVPRELQPLRDVVALREVRLQQTQSSLAWPVMHFAGVVYQACDAIAAEKRQQKALQLQMQQLIAPSASISAAAATAAATDPGNSNDAEDMAAAAMDGESASDECMDIDAEAMDVLATAAEDFLVQQFRSANELALYAGRQELQPQDLRLALATNGYRHLLRQLPSRRVL